MKVSVIGSGYMGKGIAHTLARGGAFVTLIDQDPKVAEVALAAMIEDVRLAEEKELLAAGSTAAVTERASWASNLEEGVRDADLVVEAVFEDINVKHAVLQSVEPFVTAGTVIATNTSAIPVTQLAAVLQHPERFFGVHWFNPAPYLPSVEIILGEKSDEGLLNDTMELLKSAGKSPVIVADTPGFICNRLQFALFKEAALMVEEGSATPEGIDAVVRSSFGYRLPFFGPFAIADMAGLDVYANSYVTLEKSFGDRFAVPPSLKARVDSGDLGTKTGGGYLNMNQEEVAAMVALRDKSYVALLALRNSLEDADS